jgi:hypothetical protein
VRILSLTVLALSKDSATTIKSVGVFKLCSRTIGNQQVPMIQQRSMLALLAISPGRCMAWANRSSVLLSAVGLLLGGVC